MGDSNKMVITLLSISLVLLAFQTYLGQEKPFGRDVLNTWFQMDDNNDFVGESENITIAKKRFGDPSSASSNANIQVTNFWDVTQIIWDFMKMIFNLIFAIPFALLSLTGMPPMIKLFVAVPLCIVAIAVFIISGVFGRR